MRYPRYQNYGLMGMTALLLVASCSQQPPAPTSGPEHTPGHTPGGGPPPVPVRVAQVEARALPCYLEEMGEIRAVRAAEVQPEVSGLIMGVHFKEGESVAERELLYTIDDAAYRIKLQEAEAQLALNQAHRDRCKKKWARYQSLSKPDLIAQVEWDNLEAELALYEAAVRASEAHLRSAELDLRNCRILAPFAGRTGVSLLQAGSRVGVGTTLVTLSEESVYLVDFALSERERRELVEGVDRAALEIYAAGEETLLATGVLTFLDCAFDQQSGLLAARGLITTLHQPIWIGQSVRVRLLVKTLPHALLIPSRAVRTNQQGAYVFSVKEDQTVEMRSIRLGPEELGMVVVEEGLDETASVVTEGQLRLLPGSTIVPIQER